MRKANAFAVGLVLTIGYVVRANAKTTTNEDDDNFREDVIVCEEAVAHASTCCGFKVQGDACRFYHYSFSDDCGCDSPGTDGSELTDVRPVLSAKEGRRIADMECATMKTKATDGTTQCGHIFALLQADNDSHSSTTKNCR